MENDSHKVVVEGFHRKQGDGAVFPTSKLKQVNLEFLIRQTRKLKQVNPGYYPHLPLITVRVRETDVCVSKCVCYNSKIP